MQGGRWQEWRQVNTLMKCSGPVFNCLSLSHGSEVKVGIKAWPGYIKSFIHWTCYAASVSDESLIKKRNLFTQHFIFSMYFIVISETWVSSCEGQFILNPLCSILLSCAILFTSKPVSVRLANQVCSSEKYRTVFKSLSMWRYFLIGKYFNVFLFQQEWGYTVQT